MKFSMKCLFFFAISEYGNKNFSVGPNFIGSVGNWKQDFFVIGLTIVILKFDQYYYRVMCPKDADGMANNEDLI